MIPAPLRRLHRRLIPFLLSLRDVEELALGLLLGFAAYHLIHYFL